MITETLTHAEPGEEAVSEATVKLRRRGRPVRRDRRGQRPGQRPRPGAAAGARCGRSREVAKFELIDYKVRILDQGHGTDAITRVLIETSDGESSWVTVGVGAQRDRGVVGGAARRAHLRAAAEQDRAAGLASRA